MKGTHHTTTDATEAAAIMFDSGTEYGKRCAASIIDKFHDKAIDEEFIARIVAITKENFENIKRVFQSKGR